MRDLAALTRIEAAYADMEAHKSGDVELIAADVRFHKEILQASGNRLLGALGSLIEMALVGTFKMGWRSLAIKDDRLHQHRDVMQAIAARRSEAARAAMAKLLQELADDVRRALAQDRAMVPASLEPSRVYGRRRHCGRRRLCPPRSLSPVSSSRSPPPPFSPARRPRSPRPRGPACARWIPPATRLAGAGHSAFRARGFRPPVVDEAHREADGAGLVP